VSEVFVGILPLLNMFGLVTLGFALIRMVGR
jgi:hypothetical protein